ncbi:damage-control phosphatase ARMT1-like [Palaemon carinicauda]|uniref:damage-control phosphatase ARMT1-like n=1 Tax=Palaemon carinicauda TaxID=392227 RepID=UPI0035B61DD2
MSDPPPPPLSPVRVGTFAYLTVRDRLPIILTRVIDHLYRDRDIISTQYGEDALEGCKQVVSALSQLKNEIQTNKSLRLLQRRDPPQMFDDTDIWNREFEKYITENEVPPKWFTASWLYLECYMYAKIHESFSLCDALQNHDPFQDLKEKSLTDSQEAVESLAAHIISLLNILPTLTHQLLKQNFIQLLEASLWGNKCDLSISCGADVAQTSDLMKCLDTLRENILVNQSDSLWQLLVALPEDQRDIVLVLDNAGFELVSDLCLMTFLMESGLATNVVIHVKTRPWFVSDTTYRDFTWALEKLKDMGSSARELSIKWSNYLSSGRWKISQRMFWTTPCDYTCMSEVEPDLYLELSKASLIIFKGDLNYRKLTGDFSWPATTPFKVALRNFCPAPLLAVRTAKGGPVVGLEADVADRAAASSPNWNISGDFGMIQLCTS